MAIPLRGVPLRFELLRRSRHQRLVAGVCGGLAEWLGWEVIGVRFLFAFGSVLVGFYPGLIAYGVLWLILPQDRDPRYRLGTRWRDDY
ncbi:MAG: PspC domain-containing protein [Myxococcota bacterium]